MLCLQVSLFHSPELRGLKKLLLAEKINELVSLHHIKLFIFDDDVIISGYEDSVFDALFLSLTFLFCSKTVYASIMIIMFFFLLMYELFYWVKAFTEACLPEDSCGASYLVLKWQHVRFLYIHFS